MPIFAIACLKNLRHGVVADTGNIHLQMLTHELTVKWMWNPEKQGGQSLLININARRDSNNEMTGGNMGVAGY